MRYLLIIFPMSAFFLNFIDFGMPARLQCLKALDGDTALVDWNGREEKLRLEYIDAPELLQKEWKGVRPIGRWSREQLQQACHGHWEVKNLRRDIYGRLLGQAFKEGQDVGILQVLTGHAIIYERAQFSSRSLKQQYHLAFSQAVGAKRGIWATRGMQSPYKFRHSKRQTTRKHGRSVKKNKRNRYEF